MESKVDYSIDSNIAIERGQAINESQAKDQYYSIPYRKQYTSIVGGNPAAAILLQQISYWWHNNGRQPFYKFKEPCNHNRYKEGDSWTEELGFSRSIFDTSLKCIAKKVTKGQSKHTLLNSSLVIYWTDASRTTWYQLNERLLAIYTHLAYNDLDLLGKVGMSLYLDNDGIPLYLSKEGKSLYLYSDTTTDTTTDKGDLSITEPDDSEFQEEKQPNKYIANTELLDKRGVFVHQFVDNVYTQFKCCCTKILDVRHLTGSKIQCPECHTPIEIRDSHGNIKKKPLLTAKPKKKLGDIIPDCPEKLIAIRYQTKKQADRIIDLMSLNRGILLESLNWAFIKSATQGWSEKALVDNAITAASRRIDTLLKQSKSESQQQQEKEALSPAIQYLMKQYPDKSVEEIKAALKAQGSQ